jgi:hypothetical protein
MLRFQDLGKGMNVSLKYLFALPLMIALSGCADTLTSTSNFNTKMQTQSREQQRFTTGLSIPFKVRVVDEAGTPVSDVDVWSLAVPGWADSKLGHDESSEFAYLDTITQAYRDYPEFTGVRQLIYSKVFTDDFRQWPTTEKDGSTEGVFAFDGAAKPSDVLHVKLSALKYGYSPAQDSMDLRKGDRPVAKTLVLHRDMAIRIPDAPYAQAISRVHYDISHQQSKGLVTFAEIAEEERQAEAARDGLIHAAQDAEAAGDGVFAARIYSWVHLVPVNAVTESTTADTRVQGYSREQESSPRNVALLHKAQALDPANRYVQMELLMQTPPTDASVYHSQTEILLRGGRADIWPNLMLQMERTYYLAHDLDDSRELFSWFRDNEPLDDRNHGNIFKMRLARYVSIKEFQKQFIIDGDVNKRDEHYSEPVLYVLNAGREDLLDWLMSHGQKTPLPGYTWCQMEVSRNPSLVTRIVQMPAATSGMDDKFVHGLLTDLDYPSKRNCSGSDPIYLDQLRSIFRLRLGPSSANGAGAIE